MRCAVVRSSAPQAGALRAAKVLLLVAAACALGYRVLRCAQGAPEESVARLRAGHVVFTTGRCPACDGLRRVIESNAERAWRRAPEVQFELVSAEEVATNRYGVPRLNSMYRLMMRRYPLASTYTFVNADILMDTRGFLDTLSAAQNLGEFLLVGRRTNAQWTEADSLENHSLSFDEKFDGGSLSLILAQDYFTVSPRAVDWERFPDVVIGRVGYDNMLVDHVVHKKGVWLVDGSRTVRALHQTDSEGDFSGFNREMEPADRRWNMGFGLPYDHGATVFADWVTVRCKDGSVCLRPA